MMRVCMHGYDLTFHDRKLTYYAVGVVAGLIGTGISWLISNATSYGFALAAPSGVAIFGLVFLIFDRWVWRWNVLYSMGIIPVPDLTGTWDVQLKPGPSVVSIPASMEIYQTYTRINVRMKTKTSESTSQMAVLKAVNPTSYKLRFEYHAEFSPSGRPKSRHYGVTALSIESRDAKFIGPFVADYYTEQGRDTFGTIVITKKGSS